MGDENDEKLTSMQRFNISILGLTTVVETYANGISSYFKNSWLFQKEDLNQSV